MTEHRPSQRRRGHPPAGAAVLQEDVTQAITEAVFAELAGVGYGRLSVEAVAKRAGVGKTAIYRRWQSKQAMVLELTSHAAVEAIDAPDAGSLRADVREFLINASRALCHPQVNMILPDLLAEVARNPQLAEPFFRTVRDPRRANAGAILDRAVQRGELDEEFDRELALDFLGGPLYWRLVVVRIPLTEAYFDRLVTTVVAAIRASSLSSSGQDVSGC
jgi:AcrR family transcriptional regulator